MIHESRRAGFGLRVGHYDDILNSPLEADCAEIVTENFMGRGGRPSAVLRRAQEQVPLILHGVGMSLGALDPLDTEYLRGLGQLISQTDPLFVSDHLCFSSVDGQRAYDLWPLPYTEEALQHVSARIAEVQDRLGRQIAIENVSSYISYQDSELQEHEFLKAVVEEADCLCLLDINNVFVSSRNHGFDPKEYIKTIPPERVAYYHLAGHSDMGTHLLDDHGSPVPDAVWELYDYAITSLGPRTSIIEWDSRLPSMERLVQEAKSARQALQQHEPTRPFDHNLAAGALG